MCINSNKIFQHPVGVLQYSCIIIYNKHERGEDMHEREIIELLLSRDERGLSELLLHYGPLMRYIIAPILPDGRDREDCLNDVAMRVWDKIETFDDLKGSFSGWLTAITRNAALNRARGGTVADSTEEIPQNTPSTLPTPEEAVLMAERKAALGRAIDGLASRDKAIFYRKYYYLQPTAQIAAELGMTERAVEGRLYRIRKRLRSKC